MILGVEEKFRSIGKKGKESVAVSADLDRLYSEWLGGRDTDKAKHFLYTQYHEVEKMTNSLAIKW